MINTEYTVVVAGKQQPVFQMLSGNYLVTVKDKQGIRQNWFAKNVVTLQERINASIAPEKNVFAFRQGVGRVWL